MNRESTTSAALRMAGGLLLALALASAPARAAEPVKIRVGWLLVPAEITPILFSVSGIARHEGKSYVLETTRFQGSPLLINALAAGEIDVAPFGYSSFALAVENAGMTDLRIFADEDRDGEGTHFTTQYVVRKDGGIATIEDLKGKVFATNAAGSIGDMAARTMLKRHRLDPAKDVTTIEIALPNMNAVLEDKKADLIISEGEEGRDGMTDGASFDYIVVGAGSAGCVLANRLSEDARASVCLIEAGSSDTGLTRLKVDLPVGNTLLLSDAGFNWGYLYEGAAGLHHAAIPAHRGRLTGGSSSVNGMVYMRGHRRDYDAWAAAGNPGWSYDEVLPVFRRQEHREAGADEFHGTGGELNVARLRWLSPLTRALLAAAAETQYPHNPDFNGARQDGFGAHEVTQKNGKRWSAARAFLDPVRQRKNLTIVQDALVARVRLEGKRATGVALRAKGGDARAGGAARSHRRRRRLQLAADPAAVGDRAGRRHRPARHRGQARAAGRRAQSARPSDRLGPGRGPLGAELRAVGARAAVACRRGAAICAAAAGAAHLQHRRGRRVRAHRSRSSGARHPVRVHAGDQGFLALCSRARTGSDWAPCCCSRRAAGMSSSRLPIRRRGRSSIRAFSSMRTTWRGWSRACASRGRFSARPRSRAFAARS